ncbi:hypothetical protein PM082_014736 [Marasmius tenuissimus]|nr:hypothetical protein PM082_014736 [Marasmius tenuissimus]
MCGPVKTIRKRLQINGQQNRALELLYDGGKTCTFEYDVVDTEVQQEAFKKLSELGLDIVSRQSLESRWSIQYSDSWTTAKETKRRTIYQCACGYDSASRSKIKLPATGTVRRVPYPFTECLAHVEVVECLGSARVSRVSGYFEHNKECSAAVLERVPQIPLHEHVYEVALTQLSNGASLTSIQEMNCAMIERKEYRGMQNLDPSTQNTRYLFRTPDHNTLYRKFSRSIGVDIRMPPQYNVDDWLDPSSPRYQPELANAIFHYSARASADERFEVCVSTKQMDEHAWKHIHQNQLVLDGTFGVCTSRLLLFIALGVDEEKKGLPVALFLFSAPTGNKASHAGYNTEILRKLLLHWRLHLEKLRPAQSFIPHSAITDTDTKEQGALLRCWTNHRKALGSGRKEGTAPVGDATFWKETIRDQLRSLETQLITTTEHHTAVDLVNKVQLHLSSLLSNPSAKSAATSALNHIKYLNANWMSLEMWRSWSEWGRIAAAARMGVHVDGVVPTTNHLESFNNILKKKHIKGWMHSGHRLRFDFLIHILVTKILPAIYSSYSVRKSYSQWLTSRFSHCSGGANLLELHQQAQADRATARKAASKRCWWEANATRDREAGLIVQLQRISVGRADTNTFQATCLSSKLSAMGTTYSVFLSRAGAGECSCPDFQSRGGACKHLRALWILVDSWIAQGLEQPAFYYLSSLEDSKPCDFSHPTPTVDLDTAKQLPMIVAQAQSMANDSTTLYLDESDNLDGSDGADCLVEPQELGGFESDSSEEQADLPTIITTAETQVEAIRQQLSSRIKHEVTHLLPRLHGLLTNVSELADIPGSQTTYRGDDDVDEFKILMSRIVDGLESLSVPLRGSKDLSVSALMCDQPTAIPSTSTPEPTAPVTRRRHTHNPSLRPPSPENRQHRHNSNMYMP